METLVPNFSPNKRPKLDPQTLDPPPISPNSDKGKAPISDEDGYESPVDLPPQNCGVCFSEEGKSVRGLIDSCNHYFCFLCIIEWSKIESRCPLCRVRFGTIRRVRKDGSFVGDGFVRIPVRDQIYDPYGEPADPYAQAKCSVCDGTHDESLLLLCDLCDSPWHTYCVGLGATVPEGNWYCEGCALLQAEQQHDGEMTDDASNSDGNAESSVTPKHADQEPTAASSISIFDIVRDPEDTPKPERGVARLLKLVSPTKEFSCPTITSGRANNANTERLGSLRGDLSPTNNETESGARTLHNCRGARKHINILRENWEALRTGSLSFSSGLLGSPRKGGRKVNSSAKRVERSRKSHSSSTPASGQTKAHDIPSNVGGKNPYDTEKAWKLMNMAKSMQHVGKPKGASKATPCKPIPARKDVMSCALRIQSPHENSNGRLPMRKHQSPSVVPRGSGISCSKSQSLHISRLSLSRDAQTSLQNGIHHDVPGRRGSTLFDGRFACSTSTSKPKAEASDLSHVRRVSTLSDDDVACSTSISKPKAEASDFSRVRRVSALFDDGVACSTSTSKPKAEASDLSRVRRVSTLFDDSIACSTSTSNPKAEASDLSRLNLHKKGAPNHPREQVRVEDNCRSSKAVVGPSNNIASASSCRPTVGTSGDISVPTLSRGLSDAFHECKIAGGSVSPSRPSKGAFDVSHGQLLQQKKSTCSDKVGPNTCDKVANDEVKSEIVSLVKLNLKLLSKHKRLGTDAFKDIARVSTHTILAACGYEHRKIVRSYSKLVCNHSDETPKHRRSTLMPSSCRECFYAFVKNVVNSVLSEKLDISPVAG